MSRKTEAVASFRAAAMQAAGSHMTVQARMGTAERLGETVWKQGYQVSGIDGLRTKHVDAYVQQRVADGASARTLQNELSHVRGMLRAADRADFAANPAISNAAQGCAGASRGGTNRAATPEQVQRAHASLSARDAGMGAMVSLARELGLRSQEAIRAGPHLGTWERQLERGERVTVISGTKGGRVRDSMPADRDRALAAVREARAVADERGGRLIEGDLRQASTAVRNAMHRSQSEHGITWHSLRYSYACDRVDAYLAAGYTRHEAYAQTACDLGHGSGRGRYVEQVYARS